MENILINFPTNIGDTILALPVLDRLRSNYPQAKISAIVSSRTKDFLADNTLLDEVIFFDKHWKNLEKMRFFLRLRGHYDAMVDLKNSFLPFLLGVKQKTPFIRRFNDKIHIADKYQSIAARLMPGPSRLKSDFRLDSSKQRQWQDLGLNKEIFVACASLSAIKQYPADNLSKVLDLLPGPGRVIILGNEKDRVFYGDILRRSGVVDLVGATSITDIFYLLKYYAAVLLGVDSSITHVASYLGVPVAAIFGPTSPERFCPRSKGSVVLRKENLACLACGMPGCSRDNECMRLDPQIVAKAIKDIIGR